MGGELLQLYFNFASLSTFTKVCLATRCTTYNVLRMFGFSFACMTILIYFRSKFALKEFVRLVRLVDGWKGGRCAVQTDLL